MKHAYFLLLLLIAGSIQAQNKQLWGTFATPFTATPKPGGIFQMTGAATDYTEVFKFPVTNEGFDSYVPWLYEAPDGMLYGMARLGGTYNVGVIYTYDQQFDTYTVVHHFGAPGASAAGNAPRGGFVEGPSGKLYGTTGFGSSFNAGAVFEFDLTTHDVTMVRPLGGNFAFGNHWNSEIISATNGKIYGTAQEGGSNSNGVIYEIDLSGSFPSFSKLFDFDRTTSGSNPRAGLVEAANGKLYGTTNEGGTNDLGVVYEYDIVNDTYLKILDFSGTADGSSPYGSLVAAANGKLYGVTQGGGANGGGVLFEVDPVAATYTKKIDFVTVDGDNPTGGLQEGADDRLYITFNEGGSNGQGTIARYNIYSNQLSTLTHLDEASGSAKTRNHPNIYTGSKPFLHSNGRVYCATNEGGVNDWGTILEYRISGNVLSTKLDFNIHTQGAFPEGGVTLASNDQFYGVTTGGGANNLGVLYSYDRATDTQSALVDFGGANGEKPTGKLVHDDSDFYGLTEEGGANGEGVLFKYERKNDIYTVLVDFSESTTGSRPKGTLLQASNGKLYGVTDFGTNGSFSTSVIFEYDINTASFQVLHELTSSDGSRFKSGLMEASNGSLYGTTQNGGLDNFGTLFEYNLGTSTFTTHVEFDGFNTGSFPEGKLMQAINGKIYGTTMQGGANNGGSLFEFETTTNVLTKLADGGTATFPSRPKGELYESRNGTLIGDGFRYEIASGSLIAGQNIDSNVELLETCNTTPVIADIESCGDYTSPSGMLLTVDGMYSDMVVGSYGCDSLITINLTIIENTWSDGAWCLGSAPTSVSDGIIGEDYTFSSDGVFSARDLTVESGVTLIVDNNQTLAVEGDFINNGSIIVESGSSLITYDNFSFTGNDVTIKRNTRYTDGKYSMVGTPVKSDPSITEATIGSDVYYYDEEQPYSTNDGLNRWILQVGILIPAVGYTQASQQEIIFVGEPNSGPITHSGTYTEDTDDANEGWQFVSNPYPAAIFVDEFLSTNPNNTGAVYIWDDNGSNTGRGSNSDYIVANESMATTTTAGGQTRYNFHIGSAQGFFIKLNDDVDTDTDFVEDMRVSGNNADGNFFRKTELPIVRLNFTNSEGLFKQAVVGFAEDATIDQINRTYDALAFNASAGNGLFTLKAGRTLALNGMPSQWESIQLQFNNEEAGIYQISMEKEAFNQSVFLRDKLTKEMTDLSQAGYSFSSESGIHTDRFELLANPSGVLGLEQNEVLVYASEHTLHISQKDNQKREYQLFNMNGKRILTINSNGNSQMNLSALPTGIYLVFDGQKTHKIILN